MSVDTQTTESEIAPSVLVVDDNPLISNVLTGLFKSQEYDVMCATNGKEALELLGNQSCDVIVCDVMMPELNGYGLFEKVRENPEFAHIPFIFLTALSEKKDVNEGMESGADDYIVKPFDPQHLLSLVKGKVARSRGIRTQNAQTNEKFRKRIIHTLSHEFRTPLVAINTGTELLLDQSGVIKENKAKSLLEAIQRGGQRLEKLVNDFMLMQQVEAGIAERLFNNRSEVVKPGDVLKDFIEAKKEILKEGGFALTFEDYASNHCSCRIYLPQFQELIWRLIENAMKFSGEDKTIELVITPRDEEVGIEIRDRGIGVNAAHVNMAMDTFGQIDREKLEQQGGGLGLALVKRYTAIHGGTFSLEARDGGGSIARVTLPFAQ